MVRCSSVIYDLQRLPLEWLLIIPPLTLLTSLALLAIVFYIIGLNG